MKINQLRSLPQGTDNIKLINAYNQLNDLLSELRKKDLNESVIIRINQEVVKVSFDPEQPSKSKSSIKKAENQLIKLVEKEAKLVPKNYYRNLWMALGMSAFGIPLGVAFGISIGNIAMMAVGIPIGFGIGIAVGSNLDQKALDEGRQLDVEIKS